MGKSLHLISDGCFSRRHLQILQQIHHEIDYVHIREKAKTAQELLAILSELEKIKLPMKKVILNDRVDVAVVKQCGGVQLAYHSLPVKAVRNTFPTLKIGRSVHSLAEARQAQQDQADFLLYGHIYPSQSKPNQQPKGVSDLKAVTASLSIPVYAIGGITPQLAKQVIMAGAEGIAVISGIWQASDPKQVVKAYRMVLNK
ncbi:thiamine phosphate synthase [Gracilibacillus alcaliphilus]|uniref:thiamine phosphate synthase n=1 Tax=Gracilibacillus alcaliphilus TaxID=1401441 RepID=UPI00195C891F|nr:thiamine phosphate synthase [Gracilibacillus alcaliphilus]MBM7679156.1 thiazole tautomerase (transcriptional regulator TenI) [Gracilibacillus alcaliphilus]